MLTNVCNAVILGIRNCDYNGSSVANSSDKILDLPVYRKHSLYLQICQPVLPVLEAIYVTSKA
jgi:hypothetical protein